MSCLKSVVYPASAPAESVGVRQQSHKPRPLDGAFDPSLTAGTITAALARKNLAAGGQQLAQRFDVFVVDILFAVAAKSTLGLLANRRQRAFPS